VEGGGGRDADFGEGEDAGRGGKVGERVDLFAAAETEDGAAEEEEGDVGADFGGEGEALDRAQGPGPRAQRPRLRVQGRGFGAEVLG